ncbi:hypothetical protein KCV04_g63, partial [Aureobasidium melanogenum]
MLLGRRASLSPRSHDHFLWVMGPTGTSMPSTAIGKPRMRKEREVLLTLYGSQTQNHARGLSRRVVNDTITVHGMMERRMVIRICVSLKRVINLAANSRAVFITCRIDVAQSAVTSRINACL